jgi:hypothetical protein
MEWQGQNEEVAVNRNGVNLMMEIASWVMQ